MTVTTAQVTTLLENVLFESPAIAASNATVITATANINPQTSTVAGLAAYLAAQPEAGIAEQVIRYYQGAFGRVPSPSEISFYVNIAEQGLTASQIAVGASAVSAGTWNTISNYFAASPEFQKDFGITGTGITTANEAAVITGYYNNILGRAPSSAEIQFYENALATGTASASTLLQYFTTSPEYQANVNATIQGNLAGAGVTAVSTPTGTDPLSSTAPIGTSTGGTGAAGSTFALTAGVDSLTGKATGNNTFVAGDDSSGNNTLSTADTITGGGGTGNVLTIAHTGAFIGVPAGVTVTGIQTVNLTVGGAATIDTTSFTGLTTLNVIDTTDTGVTTTASSVVTAIAGGIVASDTTTVNELKATGNVYITGGDAVNVTHSGSAVSTIASVSAAGAVTITDTDKATSLISVFNAAGGTTITANGATGGEVRISGTTPTATVTDSSGISYATRAADLAAKSAAIAANTAATTASAKATSIDTALHSLAGLVAVGQTPTVAQIQEATLLLSSEGAITSAQGAAINAAFYDALNASGGTVAKADAAALALITPLVSAADTALTAATAAATLSGVALSKATTTVTNDNNVGNLEVDADDAQQTGLTSITVTGNYNGFLEVTDNSTLQNTLTTVTLVNSDGAEITGKAVTTINATDVVDEIEVFNSTANHTETFNLNNLVGLDGGSVFIEDNNATTVVINGTGTLVLDVEANLATTLTLKGTGSFDDTDAGSGSLAATAVIDATGYTGTVAINVGHGQTFKGGSGGSTVILDDATAQTAAVNGGSGANTLVIDQAGAISTAKAAALFTGFATVEDQQNTAIDVSTLTNSTVTKIVLDGSAVIVNGLNATEAAAVTDLSVGGHSITLGVSGASTVGQQDTVHLTFATANGGAQTLTGLTTTGVETLHLTLANDLTTAFNDLVDSSLNQIVVDGKGDFTLNAGAFAVVSNTVIDASAVDGNVTIDAHLTTGNALAIKGSTTGNDILTGNGLSDVFTAGNGFNTITNGAGTAALSQSVTVGDGVSTIVLNDTHADTDTVVAGNGTNSITDLSNGGTVNITVGTGPNNFIDVRSDVLAASKVTVTLGTHAGDAGADVVLVAATSTAPTAASTVIKGAVIGDIVGVADAASLTNIDATTQTAINSAVSTQGTTSYTLGNAITAALADLHSGAGLAGHEATSFVYNGNTYLLENHTNASELALSAGDTLVELTGVHTFSTTVGTGAGSVVDLLHTGTTYTTGALTVLS